MIMMMRRQYLALAVLAAQSSAFGPTSVHVTITQPPRIHLFQSSRAEEASDFAPKNPFPSDPIDLVGKQYSRLVKEQYLPMAFLQAGCLASAADVATQTLEHHHGEFLNVPHVAAMATVAAIMSGAINAMWLRQLEERWPGKQARAVAIKTTIHAVILASIINSAYLVGVPALTDLWTIGAESSLSWSMEEFLVLTKLELFMFVPYNTVAFSFVPPSVRPLTHALISATFTVAVSAVTLGYFDAWCDRAVTLLGL